MSLGTDVMVFSNGAPLLSLERESVAPWLAMTTYERRVGSELHLSSILCTRTFLCSADDGYGIYVGTDFFCDNSSGWVLYDPLPTPGGGSAVVKAIDHGPLNMETCGGIYGETRDWEVEISVLPVMTGMLPRLAPGALDGCFATFWTNHSDGYCPGSSTALDTFGVFRARGPGVLIQMNFGNLWLDYFLGNGARVSYRPTP